LQDALYCVNLDSLFVFNINTNVMDYWSISAAFLISLSNKNMHSWINYLKCSANKHINIIYLTQNDLFFGRLQI